MSWYGIFSKSSILWFSPFVLWLFLPFITECDIRSCLNTLQFVSKKKETLNAVRHQCESAIQNFLWVIHTGWLCFRHFFFKWLVSTNFLLRKYLKKVLKCITFKKIKCLFDFISFKFTEIFLFYSFYFMLDEFCFEDKFVKFEDALTAVVVAVWISKESMKTS